jgi:hypothetical protein
MSRRLMHLVAVLVLGLCTLPAHAAEPTRADAVLAAKGWLALVDAGKFDESWDGSGAVFRQAVTKPQWNQALAGSRTPLGALVSRELDSATEAATLPGAPDGKYVVMQFRTSFANKAAAVETVTTSLEADARWRVVGYYIK